MEAQAGAQVAAGVEMQVKEIHDNKKKTETEVETALVGDVVVTILRTRCKWPSSLLRIAERFSKEKIRKQM